MVTRKSVKKAAKKAVVRADGKRTGSLAAAKSRQAQSAGSDFASVFAALKKVMAAHSAELHPTADEPRKYYLVTKSKSWKGGPMYFGAVIAGKAYVSYHLMPLYIFPELKKSISVELKRRMQGKSCFNFRQHDEALMTELGQLTRYGLEAYRSKGLL